MRLFLQSCADLIHDLLFVRKLSGFQLGIQQFPIRGQLKAASAGGNELEFLNLLFVKGQQFRRQTDGLRFIVSH
jgi:hypothetical protein